MTLIGPITVDTPATYRFDDYDVEVTGTVDSINTLRQIRELFAFCREGSVVQVVLGGRPQGLDHNQERRNTQYVKFTHGSKPRSGWYLLRNFITFEDETPLGFSGCGENFSVTVFFLGSDAYYQAGFRVLEMEDVSDEISDNDWGL